MIGTSIKDQLKKLVELQKIDVEIFNCKKELKEKPAHIERLKFQFEGKKSKLKSLEEKLKSHQVDQRNNELDLKSKEELITKADVQLSQLKTNKEYQAKLLEIENIKADNSLIEEKILVLYDLIDAIKKEVEQERAIVAEEEKKFIALKKQVDDELALTQQKEQRFEGERRQIVPSIHPEYLARYERVLHNRDGLGLVPVKNHACGGCFMNVPDQVINQIKMYDQLVFCEMCARLIYLEDEL